MDTKKTKQIFKQRTIKRLLPTFLFSAVGPFLVCICIPFEIFANNIDQFVFAVKDFFPLAIAISFIATLSLFLILLFLPQKAYRIIVSLYLSLSLMFFLQGTFLNAGANTLAGDGLGVKIPTITKVLNLLLWVVVIGVAVFFAVFNKWHDVVAMVSVGLCAVIMIASFMSPFALALTTKNVFKTKAERVRLNNEEEYSILTTKNLTTISSQGNVFIFLVDVMDKEYLDEAFEKRPEIFDDLDGFTYFEDSLSLYGHTFPSVANMLTGQPFDLTKKRPEYLNDAYKNAVPLDVLHENNYQLSLYTKAYYAFEDASLLPDYISNVSKAETTKVIEHFPLSTNFMHIALYRCFPLLLKPLVGNIDSSATNTFLICQDEEGRDQYSTDLKFAHNYIQETKVDGEFTVIDDKKVFSFIHFYGCHSVDYDENWGKPSGKDRNDMTLSLMHSFNIIGEYISAMKKADVYDDSTIIILGDHGIPKDNYSDLNSAMQTGLFIKQSGAGNVDGQGYKTTNRQVSHAQIWSTIFDSEGITLSTEQQAKFDQTSFKQLNPDNRSHFEILESENVNRYFFWHTYTGDCDEYRYLVNGNGQDFDNWIMYEHLHADKFIMN